MLPDRILSLLSIFCPPGIPERISGALQCSSEQVDVAAKEGGLDTFPPLVVQFHKLPPPARESLPSQFLPRGSPVAQRSYT